jgi:FkbM family methyltransferase
MTGGAKRFEWLTRRFGPDRVVTVDSGPAAGLRMGLQNASADYSDGSNELPVQEAIAARLAPGAVFFDVGANVGFFSVLAARAVGAGGRVLAFEAVPDNADCVTANAERNGFGQLAVHAVAVGDQTGTATLNLARHPGGAVLASAGAPPDAAGTIEVPVVVLDDLIERGELPVPDLVKVDVEGAEEAVVAGLRRTLEKHHPALVIEVDASTVQAMEARVSDFVELLSGLGYEVDRLPGSYGAPDWHVAHLVADAHDARRTDS